MNHELKIWPQFYAAVKDGRKTFEVRENDRAFQAGDTVTLREWDPNLSKSGVPGDYTPAEPLGPYKIGYVLPIDSKRVAFSLLPLDLPPVKTDKLKRDATKGRD